jgi:hypothetical protein
MAVRTEKIIVTVLHEAHERQVEETMETLGEGPNGFYASPKHNRQPGFHVFPFRGVGGERDREEITPLVMSNYNYDRCEMRSHLPAGRMPDKRDYLYLPAFGEKPSEKGWE